MLSPLKNFPSFSEGLSLRQFIVFSDTSGSGDFPSFSEGLSLRQGRAPSLPSSLPHFPSFSEGLSLRHARVPRFEPERKISLPFRRDFH